MKARILLRFLIIIYLLYVTYYSDHFYFMNLNVFLAWIPIELAFATKRINNKILLGLIFCIWLIFYPNIPYLYTDLLHVRLIDLSTNGIKFSTNYQIWIEFITLILPIVTLPLIGSIQLDQISNKLFKRIKIVIIPIIIILSSIAIYVGRFIRLHSIDLLTNPITTFNTIFNQWDQDKIYFVLLFSLLQLGLLLCTKFIKSTQIDI